MQYRAKHPCNRNDSSDDSTEIREEVEIACTFATDLYHERRDLVDEEDTWKLKSCSIFWVYTSIVFTKGILVGQHFISKSRGV